MRFNDLVQACGEDSDKVRAALNALPPDIVMDIPSYRLPEVIHRIGAYGRACYEEGEEAAIRRNAGPARADRERQDLSKWPPMPGEEDFRPTETAQTLQEGRKQYWIKARGLATTLNAWAAYNREGY